MQLTNVKENIPFEIPNETLFNISTNGVNNFTHGFHKYAGKFIPQIPKWAISKYLQNEKNKWIFDPFCGSGTTLVEGILSGNNVIGTDIDGLSCLISKVKTTKIDSAELNKVFEWLENGIKNDSFLPDFKPECATLNHWFIEDYSIILSKIRTAINQIENAAIQNLALLCFSSIIRRVSNADNQSQKAYVSHTHVKTPENPITLFLAQLKHYQERITEFSNLIDSNLQNKIIHFDTTKPLNKIIDFQIDLAVTSPPYIKAIDYIYNQMVELFWVGDLFDMQTQEKQNTKKVLYVGNKQIAKKEYTNYSPFETIFGIQNLDKNLQTVFEYDLKNGHKHSYITYKYFAEMEKHFAEMSKIMAKNSHYIMVVGNSNVSNISFETDKYLIEIAQRNGFELATEWGYIIKNRYMRFDRKDRGGIIDIDWVMDFVKV
jgi:DNA modification methylase